MARAAADVVAAVGVVAKVEETAVAGDGMAVAVTAGEGMAVASGPRKWRERTRIFDPGG
eukprot:SAG11_NODE_530_length_8718_cov_12.724910_4_plen_59_part_00